ncbi:hypothetical protein P879_01938 [Paragonimus westermani]|uniref:Uncharacterized protein n=1 Tax=Paragonimus westermani TaxID=34504 RepID=A0A8T0D2J5_9TREM|nr:hypothetical protein P879_01938 [Paragonimus westermani]
MILYISLAVFGGVLLLAVIIIILKKAGFFKRKRFIRRQKRTPKEPEKQPMTSEYVVARTARERTQAQRQPIHTYGYVPDSRDSQHSTQVPSPITAYQQPGQSQRHNARSENRSSAVASYTNREPRSTGSAHYR